MLAIDPRFAPCFLATLREESGEVQRLDAPIRRTKWSYLDDPADPGGATMCGVTHAVYDGYRDLCGLPRRDVRAIEDSEIAAIYQSQYWAKIPGDDLPAGVDMAVFDFAFHSGPGRAVQKLQAVVGARVDGHLGAATLAKVHDLEPLDVVQRLMSTRRDYARSLKNYWRFKKNWEGRLDRIEAASVAYARQGADAVPVVDFGDWCNGWTTTVEFEPGGRMREAEPSTMIESTEGKSAAAAGAGGTLIAGADVAAAAKAVYSHGHWDTVSFLLELGTRPAFWVGMGIAASTALAWFEGQRRYGWRRP